MANEGSPPISPIPGPIAHPSSSAIISINLDSVPMNKPRDLEFYRRATADLIHHIKCPRCSGAVDKDGKGPKDTYQVVCADLCNKKGGNKYAVNQRYSEIFDDHLEELFNMDLKFYGQYYPTADKCSYG